MSTNITPFIWVDADPLVVARFYESVFDDCRLVSRMHSDSTEVVGCTIEIGGSHCALFNGGPGHPHDIAFSMMVLTESQEETDRYWEALSADGGQELPCGWVKDRFGVHWQVTPRMLMEILAEPETAARARAFNAMLQMSKLDIATIERAHRGDA